MAKAEQKSGNGPHGTIAEAIRHRYGELTTTERKPAQTLLGNYPFAGLDWAIPAMPGFNGNCAMSCRRRCSRR
jgi:hypothetical protein